MNLDPKEMKRQMVVFDRRLVASTRRAYENLLLTTTECHKDLTDWHLLFLEWHLVAYMNYLESVEADEERTINDKYAQYVRAILKSSLFGRKLPPLPFWTPSIVSEVK